MIETLTSLDDATRRAVLRLAETTTAHDGVAPFDEETRLDLREPHAVRTHLVVRAGAAPEAAGAAGAGTAASEPSKLDGADSSVVGYAWTDGVSGELAVHPDHRRRGVGAALLDALLATGPRAAIWAHGHLDAARALAEARGLVVTRELLTMRWRADAQSEEETDDGRTDVAAPSAPVRELPEGYSARSFRPHDLADFTAANAEVFVDHPEQGRLTVEDMSRRIAEPWFDAERLRLVEAEGEIAAFCWVKPGDAEDELYLVGVREPHRGRGLSSWLVRDAQAATRTRGRREMLLYVEGDNVTAISSYTRAGFLPDSSDVQYSVDEALA